MALVKDFVNVIVNLETVSQSQYIPTLPELDISAAIWQPGSATIHAAFLSGTYENGGEVAALNFIDNANVSYSGSADANITKTTAIGGRVVSEFSVVTSNAVSPDQNTFIEYQIDASNRAGFIFYPSVGMVRAYQVVGGVRTTIGDPILYDLGTKTLVILDTSQPTGVSIGIVIGNTIYARPTSLVVDVDATMVQNIGFETLSGSHVTRVTSNNGNVAWTYVVPSGYYPIGLVLAAGSSAATGDFVGKNFASFTSTTLQFLIPEDATGSVVTLDATGTAIDGHTGAYRKRKTTVSGDQIVEFWSSTAPANAPIYAFMTYTSSGATWSDWRTLQGTAGGSPWYPGGDGDSNLFDPIPFITPVSFDFQPLSPSTFQIDSSTAGGQLSDFGVIDEPTVTFQGNRYVELLPSNMNNTGTLQTAFSITSDTGEEIGVFFTINGANVTALQFYKDGFSDAGVPTTPLLSIPYVNGQTLGLAFNLLPESGNLVITATTATDEVLQDTGISYTAGANWSPVFKAITNSLSTTNVYDTEWLVNTGYYVYAHDVPAGFHVSGKKERNWTPGYNPLIDPFAFAEVSDPAKIAITDNRLITYDSSGAGGNVTVGMLSRCGGALYLEFTPISVSTALTDVHFQFVADPTAVVPSGTWTLGFVYSFADSEFTLWAFDGTTPTATLDIIDLDPTETVSIAWNMETSGYLISNTDRPLQQAAGITTGVLEFEDDTIFTPSFTQLNDTDVIEVELNLGQYPLKGDIPDGHTPIVLCEMGVREMDQPTATAGIETAGRLVSAKILSDTIDLKIAAIPPADGVDHVSASFFPTLGALDGMTRDDENATINYSFAGSGFRTAPSDLTLVDLAIFELTGLAPDDAAAATGVAYITMLSASGAGDYMVGYDFDADELNVYTGSGGSAVSVGSVASAIGETFTLVFNNNDGIAGPTTPTLDIYLASSGPVVLTLDMDDFDIDDQQGIGVQAEQNSNGKILYGLTRSVMTRPDVLGDTVVSRSLVEAAYLGLGSAPATTTTDLGANSGFRLFDDPVNDTSKVTGGSASFANNNALVLTGFIGSATVRTQTTFGSSFYVELTPDAAITEGSQYIVFGRVNADGSQGGGASGELGFEYNSATNLLIVGHAVEDSGEFTLTDDLGSSGVASVSGETYGVTVELVFDTTAQSALTYTIKNLTTGDSESQSGLTSAAFQQQLAYSLLMGVTTTVAATGNPIVNLGQFPLEGAVPNGTAPPAWNIGKPLSTSGTKLVDASLVQSDVPVLDADIGANSIVLGARTTSEAIQPNSIAIGADALKGDTGSNSTAVGRSAGKSNSGDNPTFLGTSAGEGNDGDNGTFVGISAGTNNTGTDAVLLGATAGYGNTGTRAIAIGRSAGSENSGPNAVLIGYQAGISNTGADQVAIGAFAGQNNTGVDVVQVGYEAGQNNTGTRQTTVGKGSGEDNAGADQAAFGLFAGLSNIGNNQTATGARAGQSNTGENQTASGFQAGRGNTAENQTTVGYSSGQNNTGGDQTAVGYQAGILNEGENQTAVGFEAGVSNTADRQTAVGKDAGQKNTGYSQTVVGYQAGAVNASLVGNATDSQTAVGSLAGLENTGDFQAALGRSAGEENTGANQVAVGVSTGYQNTGDDQTALGFTAGQKNTGGDQTAVGSGAGKNNDADNQTAIGSGAGEDNTGGSQTAIGKGAGSSNSGGQQTTLGQAAGQSNSGVNETAVGFSAGQFNSGDFQTTIGIGAGFFNTGDNQSTLGAGAGERNGGADQVAVGVDSGQNNLSPSTISIGAYAGTYAFGTLTTFENTVVIGTGTSIAPLIPDKDNQVILGNEAIAETVLRGVIQADGLATSRPVSDTEMWNNGGAVTLGDAASSGPTVLVDWTTVSALSTNLDLLDGVTLPNGTMDHLRIEIEDFSIDSIYGGGSYLGLIPRRTGDSEASVTYNMRYETMKMAGIANQGISGATVTRYASLSATAGRQTARLTLDITTTAIRDATVVRESLGLCWDSSTTNNNTGANSGSIETVRGTLSAFSAVVSTPDELFTELWLIPENISGTGFTIDSFKYRILDTSV